MVVKLLDQDGNAFNAEILKVRKGDLKKLKNWKFNWKQLSEIDNTQCFKLQTQDIEALLIIQFIDHDFFEMKNLEVSPSNYGSNGKYMNAAQIMISYACLLAFEFNKGPHNGYLTFVSKGRLIDYYIEKYNAELVFRERMQINPINGLKLIKRHLNIEL